ncbi:hypothetical protein [Streptomyces sp. NPDC056144]|uniref:hypothetical protein n=1 Tax=unclassified Streptomyces TaxID=2593676 RepID=UPI0035E1C3E7
MTSTIRATGRTTARRRAAAGVLAAGLALALWACGGVDDVRPVADNAVGGPKPSPRCAPPKTDRTVDSIPSLIRPYGLPTLVEFARDDHVANVISGTVTASRVEVVEPGAQVLTYLTVAVERQREAGRPTTVTVREEGGIVARPDETVDYRFYGTEHACVGQRVLVVVADDSGRQKKQGAYTALARLVREGNSTTYTWPGDAPNPKWEKTVDIESLM